jgi:hypothetical protein
MKNNPLIYNVLWVFFAVGLLPGCAGQVPPGGGPVDTVPPAIVRTLPDTNAVHVATRSVTLEFSEYVDRRTVEESIFISPYVGDLEYDWSSTEVTATFTEPLRKNTTYVVNVGTDIADLRAGNRMASAFTLAFSTGDSIDQGVIGGRVFDEKPEGIMIFGYRLDGIKVDTLDPTHSRPDFITQTGKFGLFTLSHLAFGTYRLLAVRDEYRNLFYERQVDQYGVSTGDFTITATAPAIHDVWFRMSREDTTRPFISGVKVRDSRRVTVRFSEAIDSASFAAGHFTVTDTLSGAALPLLLGYQERTQKSVATLLTAVPLDSPATYRVRAFGMRDLAGNPIDTSAKGDIFPGILAPDTLRPGANLSGIRDSARNVDAIYPLEYFFTDAVRQSSLASAFRMTDSAKAEVKTRLVWTSPASVVLVPLAALKSKAWYGIRLPVDSVRSLFGKAFKDSVYVRRFETADLRQTGHLRGEVTDRAGAKGKGRIFVTASSIDMVPPRSTTSTIPGPGDFSFDRLMEGKYVISAFRDADSSGTYSFGKPVPFVPSERFTTFPDTIRVRARWGVEGVHVELKAPLDNGR